MEGVLTYSTSFCRILTDYLAAHGLPVAPVIAEPPSLQAASYRRLWSWLRRLFRRRWKELRSPL